jgi:hypothetical protein
MSIRPDEPLPRLVTNPALVHKAEQLMKQEIAECPSCKEKIPPRHFRSFIKDGTLIQTPCGGRSRVFDPTTSMFVGHPHCTCDYCF